MSVSQEPTGTPPAQRGVPVGMLVRRVVALPFLLLLVVSLAFVIFHALPGDPARTIAGPYGDEATLKQIRAQLGIDKPFWTSYWDFLVGLAHGSLGTSYFSKQTVLAEISQRLPGSIELIVASVVSALVWGAVLGGISAYRRNRPADRVSRGIVGLQLSVPDFVIGVVLVYLLAYRVRVFPQATGQLALVTSPPHRITGMYVLDSLLAGDWATFQDAFDHLILPAVAEGALLAAIYARVIRSKLIASLQGPQVEFARACGLRERTVLWYAAKEARGAVLTYTALIVGALLGSDAVVETVFNWNGVAQWGIESIGRLDVPAMQGFVVVTGTATIVIYLVLDVLVLALDPRLRRE